MNSTGPDGTGPKDFAYTLHVRLADKAMEALIRRASALAEELERAYETIDRIAKERDSAATERDRLLQDLLLASLQVSK